MPNAILIENQQNCRGASIRNSDEPMVTVNTGNTGIPSHMPMAFVCHPKDQRTMPINLAESPVGTITTCMVTSKPSAFIEQGSKTNFRDVDAPANTVVAGDAINGAREEKNGRVVKLSARCLARFQTIPDWYDLPKSNSLAGRIIGNAVPALLAQRVMESLLRKSK